MITTDIHKQRSAPDTAGVRQLVGSLWNDVVVGVVGIELTAWHATAPELADCC